MEVIQKSSVSVHMRSFPEVWSGKWGAVVGVYLYQQWKPTNENEPPLR